MNQVYLNPDESQISQKNLENSEYILEVENLKKYFPIKGGILQRLVGQVKAVDDVSFKVKRGETIGIVGESGCGKTTLGRLILGLIEPSEGSIKFQNREITQISRRPEETIWRRNKNLKGVPALLLGLILGLIGVSAFAIDSTGNMLIASFVNMPFIGDVNFLGWVPVLLTSLILIGFAVRVLSKLGPLERNLRTKMQIVFQDPYASLNLRASARKTLREPILVHKIMKKEEVESYLISLLEEVGLSAVHLERFPHEFSGGQRQRITVARALVLSPELIILDEPTASADVSVRAKILNLLAELQQKRGLTYLFISHDLSIIEFISDRIIVMYLGHIVEIGQKMIFRKATENNHPYTRALIAAIPKIEALPGEERIILKGDVPSPVNPPPGCVFHTRCPQAMQMCTEIFPELMTIGPGHQSACHLFNEEIMAKEDTTPYTHIEELIF